MEENEKSRVCKKDVTDFGVRYDIHWLDEDYERKEWMPLVGILEEIPRQVWRWRRCFQGIFHSCIWDDDIPESLEPYKSCRGGLNRTNW